jgi:hypothetical protein
MRTLRTISWVILSCGSLSSATLSCGGAAEGFGPSPLDGGEVPRDLPAANRSLAAEQPSSACEAAVVDMSRRLSTAIGHHLGPAPAPVTLPEVSGAAPAQPGRLSIAVTGESVHLQGWSFALHEGKDIARVFEGERRVAALMLDEGAPDVRAVDLWVDASVSVSVLHEVLSWMPKEFEPRLVVALAEAPGIAAGDPGQAAPGGPDWIGELAAELASPEVTVVETALRRGFDRAAPECDPLRDALTASKLRDYDDKNDFFIGAVANGARACKCEEIDMDALVVLTLLATRATGTMTGVFPLSPEGDSVVQPRTASVGVLAKELSSRAAADWTKPVSLELEGE